ncbi:MAG: DNA repair protein RecO [Bacteroidetes bacterium]|nr:DNA repair protein RecO [Bacteroidota bacterium]
MVHKTSGIILHTTKYSENSLIIKAYTRHFGLQSYIINNVRSKKSKNKATLFQPLTLLDMVVSNNNKSKLQRISEITVHHQYTSIPYDVIKSSIAIFIHEVLYRAIKEEHADEELFEYLQNALFLLDLTTDSCSNFHIYFMIQLSRYLGFYPQGKYTPGISIFDLQEGSFNNVTPIHNHYLNPAYSSFLNDFILASPGKYQLIMLNKSERKHLLQTLIIFYQLHVTSFGAIRSHTILEEMVG